MLSRETRKAAATLVAGTLIYALTGRADAQPVQPPSHSADAEDCIQTEHHETGSHSDVICRRYSRTFQPKSDEQILNVTAPPPHSTDAQVTGVVGGAPLHPGSSDHALASEECAAHETVETMKQKGKALEELHKQKDKALAQIRKMLDEARTTNDLARRKATLDNINKMLEIFRG